MELFLVDRQLVITTTDRIPFQIVFVVSFDDINEPNPNKNQKTFHNWSVTTRTIEGMLFHFKKKNNR